MSITVHRWAEKRQQRVFWSVLFFTALLLCSACRHGTSVYYQYPNDKNMWAHTFAVSEAFCVPNAPPVAIIIPHHDICLFEQNSFYKALSAFPEPEVVVVLSPDHFEKGEKSIAAPRQTVFYSPEGKIPLAKRELSLLKKDATLAESVSFQTDVWQEEHGIFAHTPFIHHYFPHARILPLALRPCATERDYDAFLRLATFLDKTLPKNALIVASVDFSHYQIPRMTALHDEVSLNTIANGESVKNLEVDSPESLFTLSEYAQKRGATERVLLHRTCTFDKIPDENIESTSHQYWAFYPASAHNIIEDFYHTVDTTLQKSERRDYAHTKNMTIILGGSGNTGAGIREAWHWDRYNTATDRGEILLRAVAGKEARFLSGFDTYLFDVPLQAEPFVQKKHGTTLKIETFPIGYASTVAEGAKRKESLPTDIHIAVFLCREAGESAIDEALCADLLSFYDVVIARYNTSTDDSFIYYKTERGIQSHNAGRMIDSEQVVGSLLALNWKESVLSSEAFPYESSDGIIPAISQFPVAE